MSCAKVDWRVGARGVPTGAVLGYDNEGQLSSWQNAPTTPTTTDSFLYDGAGTRVAQQVTSGGVTTTTTYVAGGLEEISDNGTSTTLTKYFTAGNGLPTAERVGTNGPLSYLAGDGLGSVSEALDGSGNVTFQQLYTPYGTSRYSSGSSPTSIGYTGQRADSTTGLDYYHARYYDPVAGQFASADTIADGLNRYGYVRGNPETATDPTGHRLCLGDDVWSCVPDSKPRPPTPTHCTSDANCGCYTLCSGNAADGGRGSAGSFGDGGSIGAGGGGVRNPKVKGPWSHTGEGWFFWMSDVEGDRVFGRHFNFHAIQGGIERYNLHFQYAPPQNCLYRWYATNNIGDGPTLTMETTPFPEVTEPAFTARGAAEQFIWQIAALTGTNDLVTGETNEVLALLMGELLYELTLP